MNERDDIRLPEGTGGLFEVAFVSYGRRLPLYLGFAALAFIVQGVLMLAAPKLALAMHGLFASDPAKTEGIREGLVQGANFVIDAFICGLVTIGVVADLRTRTPADDRAVLGDTLARWWILALLVVVVNLLFSSMLQDVLTSDDPTMLLLLPVFLVFLGALSLATVVAAVDRTTNEALLFRCSPPTSSKSGMCPSPNSGPGSRSTRSPSDRCKHSRPSSTWTSPVASPRAPLPKDSLISVRPRPGGEVTRENEPRGNDGLAEIRPSSTGSD
jgi:hypothetical protein